MPRHIVLTGARQVGKSTLVERLLAQCSVPIYGFFTRCTPRQADGTHSVHLLPANAPAQPMTTENHVGDACYGHRSVYPAVFDRLGVAYLSHRSDGIIVMDELGFMESNATAFCMEVLRCFDGDVPIIAVCKDKRDVEFLDQVRAHPNAALYTVTAENRNALYTQLLPKVSAWFK